MTTEDLIKIEMLGFVSNESNIDELLTFVENQGKMTKVIFQSTIKKAKEIKNIKEWRDKVNKAFELRVKTINDGRYAQKDAKFFYFGTALMEAMELEEFKKYMEANREELQKVVVVQ